LDNLISTLDLNGCTTHCFSLVSTEQALVERLNRDIAAGKRDSDITERSVARISLYDELDTVKIDVSTISPADAARRITERMAGVQANIALPETDKTGRRRGGPMLLYIMYIIGAWALGYPAGRAHDRGQANAGKTA
jgi:hypothetical protein